MSRETICARRTMFVVCLAGLVLATIVTATAVAQPAGPATSIFLNGSQGNNGWYTSDVNVTLNATDHSALGINRTEYNFNGNTSNWILYTGPFKITKEDTNSVFYRSVDNASIVEPTRLFVVNIDKTPPSIAYVLTPAPNANGWTTQNVQVHFEVSDSLSGLLYSPHDLTLTNEGEYSTLSGTATDAAGNTASVAVPALGIDRTLPVLGNLTVQGNAYVGDYLPISASVVEANPQRMEWDFGDGTGTIATVGNNVARTSHAYKQPGSYRITLDVVDKAGNAARSTATVTVYGTVPTTLATATPTAQPATPTPTPVPLPSVTPAPTPAPSFLLVSLTLVGGAMLLASARKK